MRLLVFLALLANFSEAREEIKVEDCKIPPRKNVAAPGKIK